MAQINVVPMIDVMLVLLVIFMVTAPFINPAQVELPSVGKTSQTPQKPLEIIIRESGEYLLRDRASGGNERVVAKSALPDEIAAFHRAQPDSRPVPNLLAAALALGVHVLFVLMLVFGVSWQTHHPDAVMVDLWET